MAKIISAVRFAILCVLAFDAAAAAAAAEAGPPIATVTYTIRQTGVNAPYYSLAITSMGSASYWSLPNSNQRTGDPYTVQFAVSTATRAKIFQLTQHLHFFRGNFKNTHPNTGSKSLTFAEGSIKNEIFYDSSKNRSINRLTALFQKISATMEFGRRLEGLRAGNPHHLASELEQMERQWKRGHLAEVQAIAPVLRTIASDSAVPETARRYAGNILERTRANESKVSSVRS